MFNRIDITTDAIREALQEIDDRLGQIARGEALLKAGKRGAARLDAAIPPYPPPSGKPMPKQYQRTYKSGPKEGQTYQSKFASIRQQKKVMALAKEGKIPYRRTGSLGKSTRAQAQQAQDGVEIVAGSNLEYAPYVVSRENQALYHEGTWWLLDEVVEKEADNITAGVLTDLANFLLSGDT